MSFDDSNIGPKVYPDEFSILSSFKQLFSDELINKIVDETNKYAYSKKISLKTDKKEIEALFGIIILMGIVKIRSTDDYFSKDPFLDFTPIKK